MNESKMDFIIDKFRVINILSPAHFLKFHLMGGNRIIKEGRVVKILLGVSP